MMDGLKKNILLTGLLLLAGSALGQKERVDTLTLLSLNDFHGAYEANTSQAGAARLLAEWQQINASFSPLITLCVGDNYSGGYFSRITQGRALPVLFDAMKVKASAIGNHEFDWGISTLKKFASQGVPYLAANIFKDSTYQNYPNGVKPYSLLKVPLSDGDTLSIAVIGLSTRETLISTKKENLQGLYFASPVKMAQKYAALLKDSAQFILLLCHIGTDMKKGQVIWTEEDGIPLTKIPNVDGILTGHSHKMVKGKIDGIPVVQAGNNGKALAQIQWEIISRRDSLGRRSYQKRFLSSQLIPIPIQGKRDSMMQARIDILLQDSLYNFYKVIALNAESLDHSEGTSLLFTEVGTLVASSYAYLYRSLMGKLAQGEIVWGLNNFGGIRTGLPQGEIKVLDAGNVIPFGGELRAFKIEGSRLKKLFTYGLRNAYGCIQSHQIKMAFNAQGAIDKIWYPVGRQWKELKDTDSCVVVAENFIVNGGDHYPVSCFVNEVSAFKKIEAQKRNPTDAFVRYLEKRKQIKRNEIKLPICEMP